MQNKSSEPCNLIFKPAQVWWCTGEARMLGVPVQTESWPASIVMAVTLLTPPGGHQLLSFLSNSPDLTPGNFDPKDHTDPGNFTECGANGTGFPLEPFLSEKLPSLS